jgi:cytochrome oxidase Cu insertion factor (SCO1/SenC/PrrC family)
LAYDISGNDEMTTGAGADGANDAPGGGRSWRPDWRLLAPLLLILVIVVVTAVLVGTGKQKQALPNHVHQIKLADFDGSVASPARLAPPLQLRNYLGQPINLRSYEGKAVLVTFLYANCQTLCPLIAANLHTAQALLPAAERAKLQIIAVSVDPRGDTPKAVAKFLAQHKMTGRMQYLIGSATQLGGVWAAWNVGSVRDAQDPDQINHSGLVYGLGASGKLITLYPGNFTPKTIDHDISGLLAS